MLALMVAALALLAWIGWRYLKAEGQGRGEVLAFFGVLAVAFALAMVLGTGLEFPSLAEIIERAFAPIGTMLGLP